MVIASDEMVDMFVIMVVSELYPRETGQWVILSSHDSTVTKNFQMNTNAVTDDGPRSTGSMANFKCAPMFLSNP